MDVLLTGNDRFYMWRVCATAVDGVREDASVTFDMEHLLTPSQTEGKVLCAAEDCFGNR